MPCCRKSCCLPEWASPEPSDAISRLRHNRPPHKGSRSSPISSGRCLHSRCPSLSRTGTVSRFACPNVSEHLSDEERPLASSMHVAEPWTRQHAGPRPSSAVLGREAARGLVLRTICAAWASASLRRASAWYCGPFAPRGHRLHSAEPWRTEPVQHSPAPPLRRCVGLAIGGCRTRFESLRRQSVLVTTR